MNSLLAQKIFPEYFPDYIVPAAAKEQRIEVYRACRTGKAERDSFLNTYEENGCKVRADLQPDDPQAYSLSVFTNPKKLNYILAIHADCKPPWTLAHGYTTVEDGVSCETRKWKKMKKNNYHVDWWLYQGAEPWEAFEVLNDENES